MERQPQKLKILALRDLLARGTDEAHPLSAGELCRLLAERGIPCGRKALYRDVAALRRYGEEILYTRRPKAGFFLAERAFEPPEVRLLMDAVLAAPFITPRKTRELLGKLEGLLSEGQAEQARGQIYVEKRVKFDNEEIYYAIDAVTRAVAGRRKLSFVYHHRVICGERAVPDAGRAFVVSPYALIWSGDKYYLAGNYEKYDSVSVYRLDRMRRAQVLDAPARPFEEVSDYRGRFDAADFARRTFRMYHGERQRVELCCADDLLEAVLDQFGNDVPLVRRDEGSFLLRVEVDVSEGFVQWLLQYGGRIRVASPESLRREVAGRVRAMAQGYGLMKKTCAQ